MIHLSLSYFFGILKSLSSLCASLILSSVTHALIKIKSINILYLYTITLSLFSYLEPLSSLFSSHFLRVDLIEGWNQGGLYTPVLSRLQTISQSFSVCFFLTFFLLQQQQKVCVTGGNHDALLLIARHFAFVCVRVVQYFVHVYRLEKTTK